MPPTPIISTQEITKGFHQRPLFSELSMVVHEGERLAVIGNNGCGKSTLLRILAGLEEVDQGAVTIRKGLRCAYVPQQEALDPSLTILDTIDNFLHAAGFDQHEIAKQSSKILGIVGFEDSSALVATLSGGWKKRLSIACALALEPDCLLLDEPTNHLDVDSIQWLEEHLDQLRCALVFVSHDRYFIERLASRVIEISRSFPKNHLTCDGGYSDYLEHREKALENLEQQRRSLANKVRREVAWLRAGVKARTTKSRARINEAHRLIDTLATSPSSEQRRADLDFSSTQRRTKELLRAEGVAQSIAGKELFSNLSLVLSPGSRIAIVGPNGSGKTTLIRTLLGELPPTRGTIYRAPNLRTVYMDQARSELAHGGTLKDFLCPHGDSVVYRGESIHVAAWAARFLFSRNHLASSLEALSGGERARALLARSMAEECDILLFDEPTNDLDIATLENLEESFDTFPGAVIIITHDRYLLDRAANTVVGIADGSSTICANYNQWEEARHDLSRSAKAQPAKREEKTPAAPAPSKSQKKLSYKDARDLSMIEDEIQKAEGLLAEAQASMNSGEFATNASKLTELCALIEERQKAVDKLYARWQELEALQNSCKDG